MLLSQFDGKTFEECHQSYKTTPATRVIALCEMMNKASNRTELEIVCSLAHPQSITHAQAKERLELMDRLERLPSLE